MLTLTFIKKYFDKAITAHQNFDIRKDLLPQISNIIALFDETSALIEQTIDAGYFNDQEIGETELIEKEISIRMKELALKISKLKLNETKTENHKVWSIVFERLSLSQNGDVSSSLPTATQELETLHSLYQKKFREITNKHSLKRLINDLKVNQDSLEREKALEAFKSAIASSSIYDVMIGILKQRGENFFAQKASKQSLKNANTIEILIDKSLSIANKYFQQLVTDLPSDFYFNLENKSKAVFKTDIFEYLKRLFLILEKIFNISFISEVNEHEIIYSLHKGDKLIGKWHIDLFNREGKYEGAWAQSAFSRRLLPNGREQVPLVYLGFNFKSSNITYQETRPLLHEIGHALEHCLSMENNYFLAGINCLTQDTLEISSLYMESYMEHPELISLFNAPAHEVISSYRFEKIRDFTYTALMSKIDIEMHKKNIQTPDELKDLIKKIKDQYKLDYPLITIETLALFDHAFWDEEYASSYYCYLLGFIFSFALKGSSKDKWFQSFWHEGHKYGKIELLEKIIKKPISEFDFTDILEEPGHEIY